MMVTTAIIGLKDVREELKALITVEKVEKGLELGAILVEHDAKIKCPVGYPFGGKLQQSIQHHKSGTMEYTVVAQKFYAEYIEFGTIFIDVGTPEHPKIYTSGSGKYPSYRPFLRPALYQNLENIGKLIEAQLVEEK
jgi:hypothetical protein